MRTISEDGLNLGLVPLFELDDGSSCKCREHGEEPALAWCGMRHNTIRIEEGYFKLVAR